MHSFQPSRGRIFFEVLCGVGIAASCGGAWLQTGASALLAASAIGTLYSLVRFFDLFGRNPKVEVEPQRIDFSAPAPVDPFPARQETRPALAAVEPRIVIDNSVAEALPTEHAAAQEESALPVKSARRVKAPRKSAGRAKPSKKAPEIDPSYAVAADVGIPGRSDLQEIMEPEHQAEQVHPPVAPLFEPEPFVRQQQRAMFGRKAG